MADETTDPFAGVDTSGFNDVDVQIRDARFGVNPKIQDDDGKPVVQLIFTEVRDNGTVQQDQNLSIGKGYKVVDNGAKVVHQNERYNKGGDAAGLSTGSKAQTLVDDVVKLNREKVMEKFNADGGKGPRFASFWEGLSFHKVSKKVPFGKPDPDGVQKTFNDLHATEFYGWDGFPDQGDVESGNTAIQTESKSEGKGESAAGQRVAGLNESDPTAYAELRDLAKLHASYTDFIGAAYELEGIAREEIQAIVDDENAWKVLRSA